ncbi:hypothetical protein QFC24_006070 [Naganishia onofrii]|uniref:Uncharacterized protein n=1 Tax=Naganishia onofrii TaxID=1851511 RepID=A0ACC2X737_9TREE|nr:hypothetical protein QFC24_006070 [Naganishia onofrii]
MVFSIDFTGKNYIVTGGNRGIGLAITRSIVSAGGNVAILYRSSSSAPQVAEGLEKEFTGVKVKAYQCDVTDQKRVGEVFKLVGEEFESGIVHGVVANAGVAIVRDALEIGQEEFDCKCSYMTTVVHQADLASSRPVMYKTNVLGVFYTAQAAARIWIEKGFRQGKSLRLLSLLRDCGRLITL